MFVVLSLSLCREMSRILNYVLTVVLIQNYQCSLSSTCKVRIMGLAEQLQQGLAGRVPILWHLSLMLPWLPGLVISKMRRMAFGILWDCEHETCELQPPLFFPGLRLLVFDLSWLLTWLQRFFTQISDSPHTVLAHCCRTGLQRHLPT